MAPDDDRDPRPDAPRNEASRNEAPRDEAPRGEMTAEDATRAHLRGPAGNPDHGFRRMQELRKISRDFPFICPVDFKPHRGSPPGQDPSLDPTFIPNHREDDGGHYLG
jgi:hypothetical protein